MNQQKKPRRFSKFRLLLSAFFGIWISIAIGLGVHNELIRIGDSSVEIISILAGAGSLILTIPGVWFVLGWMVLIIQFIWDFFLDRITEISDAVKGKKETRSS